MLRQDLAGAVPPDWGKPRRLRLIGGVLAAVFGACVLQVATAAGATGPALGSAAGLTVTSQERLDPRLLTVGVETSALPGPANVRILLPAGYGAHPHRRYPVVYLLHGTSGGAADWTTKGDAEATTAGKPMIVVMPDIALGDDGGGWCTNWPGGQYSWERFHIGQLLPWVDHNLRTIHRRAGRAIIGLSQGGFCSMSYAARHPDLFSAAYSYSGAPDIAYSPDAVVGSTLIINATEVGLDGVPPNSIFGDRLTNQVNWAAHDPATLAENLRATRLYLYTGNGLPGPLDDVDPVSIPGLLSPAAIETLVHQDTIDFHNRIQQLGIPSYFNDYGPGTHSWGYWARDLRWSIDQLSENFADPPARPKPLAYTSAENAYSIYRWHVRSHRDAREFSTLRDARCHAFRLRGSGAATVRTPPCMKPGRRFRVTLRGDQVEKQVLHASANRKGRLKLEVPLGPSNPYQQYTVEAALAGTAVYETAVRIKRRR